MSKEFAAAIKKGISETRESHSNVPRKAKERIAVIVLNPNKNTGVQFWTEEMIPALKHKNTDGSYSIFIERL